MSNIDQFIDSIDKRECVVGIIGMGYVGLPLALEFCDKNFRVIGFDLDQEKVDFLNNGQSYIKHISAERIKKAKNSHNLDATNDFLRIQDVHAILICVPTPLTIHREPDLKYIVNTANSLAKHIRPNQLIVLESTTYPGTTEEVLIPILEEGSDLKTGKDFWIAFSPEREDPNNLKYNTATIPKVVGGYTDNCQKVACKLYDQIIVKTVPVSSCATAEATKLLENIFRSVNIALVNELKVIFNRMGIDIWEVIEAAKSKPFGYMPFYPGPGLGGHCIPIDPFYLTWKAKEYGLTTRFIELAGEINTTMPEYVVQRTMEEMNEIGKPLKGSKLLIIGLAYKNDIDDPRESPSFTLIELFRAKGAEVSYHDPYIPKIPEMRRYPHLKGIPSTPLELASDFDVAVISTKHSDADYDLLLSKCPLIIDTRNAYDKKYPNVKKA